MLHRCDVRDGEGWRGADRTDEARKRHENHGNRGSSWIAALGQHSCRQSPRSSAGTAMLRLLHDRGQAGEFDRRSRLRQRSTRRGVAQGRHRDDRAASQQQKQAAHARSATAKPLYATLASGALLCLDSMAAPHPRPLGILRPELPRLRTARLPRCPLQAILRQVLVVDPNSFRPPMPVSNRMSLSPVFRRVLFKDRGSVFEGGVKVCKRTLVNEVLGPLLTEFFPYPTYKGATPIQRRL